MSRLSLARRVVRYAPTLLDPRENRLTEVLAWTLAVVPEFASDLVVAMGGRPPESPAFVRTQRSTVGGRFVDLEISYGSLGAPELLIWIEIKHGASLHESQMESYETDMVFEPAAMKLLGLLAPRDAMPAWDGPSRTWQEAAVLARRRREQLSPNDATHLALDEFLRYLDEEGLMDPTALTAADAFELTARPAADRAITELTRLATAKVEKGWLPAISMAGGAKPAFGAGWWAAYPVSRTVPAETWGDTHFEWTVRLDDFHPASRDAIAFFAGATFTTKNNPLQAKNDSWLAARRAEGFERMQAWFWRLWRVRYPEELLAESTIDAQAQVLADWILESFRILEESPPPV